MLIASVAFSLNLSAQTIVFNVQEIKAKDFSQSDIEAAYETCCAEMKPNKGCLFSLYCMLSGIKTKIDIKTIIPPTADIIAASVNGLIPSLMIM